MTRFKSLSELFAEEKAERVAKHEEPQPQPTVSKKAGGSKKGSKKECIKCHSLVWAMHTKDGLCKDCRSTEPVASKPKVAEPTEVKPERSEETTKGATAMRNPKKLRASKNITTTHWHEDPASYNQTTRLKNETGKVIDEPNLKTWGIGLTKFEASELISMCADGDAEMAREALIDQHGAEIWEGKPKTKAANTKAAKKSKKSQKTKVTPVEPVADPPEEDYESIIAELKKKNRGLKAANTRMKNSREEEAA